MKATVHFHSIDALKNGSFVRTSKHGVAQYMNGDYLGMIAKVPDGLQVMDAKEAKQHLPKVCR
jgi:hypothetical protein